MCLIKDPSSLDEVPLIIDEVVRTRRPVFLLQGVSVW